MKRLCILIFSYKKLFKLICVSVFHEKGLPHTTCISGKDTCVTPVLDMEETADVEHFKQREAYRLEEGKWVPQPAPRIYSSQQFAALLQSNKARK